MRAITIMEKAGGPEYPDFASGLNNLALLGPTARYASTTHKMLYAAEPTG